MEIQTQAVCPHSKVTPKAIRGKSTSQSRCSVVDEAKQRSCSFLLVLFWTSAPGPPYLSRWALFGGGRGLPGHSTQQMEARGSRVCLPQQVQSGMGSDLCLVPYVRRISPHMSFSIFSLAWGWIWDRVILRGWPEVREPQSCSFSKLHLGTEPEV